MKNLMLEQQTLQTPTKEEQPFISVLVPVRNEEMFIRDTLEQLLEQYYDEDCFEILVADGMSTDHTCDIVRELQADHPNLRLLANPDRLSSAGRNVALREARGEILVLVDGHCQLEGAFYLREIADAFLRSGASCLGRPQPLDVSNASPLQHAVAIARSSRFGHHPDSHIYSKGEGFVPPQSVAVAYRREVFETVGLFDQRFDACEDVELNHRVAKAGLSCFFTPRVQVHYHPRASLSGLYRQLVRYGRGRVRLLRKHPETFTPIGFVPAAFVAGLVLGPLLALMLPVLWPVYLGVVGLYLALVLGFSTVLSFRQRSLRSLVWLPMIFVTIHLAAGSGILLEMLFGRRIERAAPSPHA